MHARAPLDRKPLSFPSHPPPHPQQVDVDRIRRDNEAKSADFERKGGLIIYTGPHPSKAVKDEWQATTKATYGLTPDQKAEVEAEFRERVEAAARGAPRAATLMASDASSLDAASKRALLARLHSKAEELAKLAAGVSGAASGAAAAAASWSRGAAGGDEEKPAAPVVEAAPMAVEAAPAAEAAPVAEPAPASAAGPSEPAAPPATATAPPPKKKRAAAPTKKAAPKKSKKKAGGGSSGPGSPDLAAAVDTVAAMGFPRRKAAEALAEVGGDVPLALEWLCSNVM